MFKINIIIAIFLSALFAHQTFDEMSYTEFRKGVIKEELYGIKTDYCYNQKLQEQWYTKVKDNNTSCN